MAILIIGSKALSMLGVKTGRPQSDIDIVGSRAECNCFAQVTFKDKEHTVTILDNKVIYKPKDNSYPIVEASITTTETDQELLRFGVEDGKKVSEWFGVSIYTANIELLYLLKMGHRFKKFSVHFNKTREDIQLIRDSFKLDYALLEKYDYWYRHRTSLQQVATPRLNKTKEEFFSLDQGVRYKYDHDSIHVIVASNGHPAYKHYAIDGEQVLSSRFKFFNRCTEVIRIRGVVEESLVLALERHQIPNEFTPNPVKSFMMSLERVCTHITGGWFREFAYDNYDKAVDMFNSRPEYENYVDNFKVAIQNGKVKLFESV